MSEFSLKITKELDENIENTMKKYNDLTNFRLILEELIRPFAVKCETATQKFSSFENSIMSYAYKLEEIDVFLRRLSVSQHHFEKLWQQVQEFESYKKMNEFRRNEDLKNIKLELDEIKNDARNDQENIKLGVNKIDMLAEQYKNIVNDIIEHRKYVTAELSQIYKVSNDSNEFCHSSIQNLQNSLENNGLLFKQNKDDHNDIKANISVLQHWIKGNFYYKSIIDLEKKTETKKMKEVEKCEKSVEATRSEIRDLYSVITRYEKDLDEIKKTVSNVTSEIAKVQKDFENFSSSSSHRSNIPEPEKRPISRKKSNKNAHILEIPLKINLPEILTKEESTQVEKTLHKESEMQTENIEIIEKKPIKIEMIQENFIEKAKSEEPKIIESVRTEIQNKKEKLLDSERKDKNIDNSARTCPNEITKLNSDPYDSQNKTQNPINNIDFTPIIESLKTEFSTKISNLEKQLNSPFLEYFSFIFIN